MRSEGGKSDGWIDGWMDVKMEGRKKPRRTSDTDFSNHQKQGHLDPFRK